MAKQQTANSSTQEQEVKQLGVRKDRAAIVLDYNTPRVFPMCYGSERIKDSPLQRMFRFSTDKPVDEGMFCDYGFGRFKITKIIEKRKAAGNWIDKEGNEIKKQSDKPDYYKIMTELVGIFKDPKAKQEVKQ